MRFKWMLLLILLIWPQVADTHETRPAYLEMKEVQPGGYRVVWKQPIIGDRTLPIYPRFPEGCSDLDAPVRYTIPGSFIERRTITCGKGGLSGQRISIDGLKASITDTLVRVERMDGRVLKQLLKPSSPSFTVEEQRSGGRAVFEYLALGIDHILRGVDHLLFVLGLLLIVPKGWMLFRTITAFTLAHSITLGFATLSYASVPDPPLNAAIAMSILFLGPEVVRAKRGGTSLTIRHPWHLAFYFGLLHGFGFASGLTALGLPRSEIPIALLLFNVGVELGQIGFVLLVFGLERSICLLDLNWPRWAKLIPGYAVGSLGAFWTMQRTTMLLGGLK